MSQADDEYIHATIHDFKTHFSRYLRMLEREEYRAVMVYRREKRVGIFIPYEVRIREVEGQVRPRT